MSFEPLKNEEFRPIDGYPGYEVSNLGRVRSLERFTYVLGDGWLAPRKITGRILSPSNAGNGKSGVYPQVSLCVEGKIEHLKVHTLVLMTFVGPRPSPKHQCRHLDGDTFNNTVENLAWGTAKENARDRELHQRTVRGEGIAQGKLTEVQVLQIRASLTTGQSARAIARDFDVHPSTIYHIRDRKTWRHI